MVTSASGLASATASTHVGVAGEPPILSREQSMVTTPIGVQRRELPPAQASIADTWSGAAMSGHRPSSSSSGTSIAATFVLFLRHDRRGRLPRRVVADVA
jgi:hypothetical protein